MATIEITIADGGNSADLAEAIAQVLDACAEADLVPLSVATGAARALSSMELSLEQWPEIMAETAVALIMTGMGSMDGLSSLSPEEQDDQSARFVEAFCRRMRARGLGGIFDEP